MLQLAQSAPSTASASAPSNSGPGKDHFACVEALWDALEEYGYFHDGTKARSYGSEARVGGSSDDNFSATQERIMWQNRVIDRAMIRLAVLSPVSYRLLHAYYRRPGDSGTAAACQEAKGWETASRYAGLSTNDRRDHIPRRAFDVLLEDAVGLLFVAHRMKRFSRG